MDGGKCVCRDYGITGLVVETLGGGSHLFFAKGINALCKKKQQIYNITQLIESEYTFWLSIWGIDCSLIK